MKINLFIFIKPRLVFSKQIILIIFEKGAHLHRLRATEKILRGFKFTKLLAKFEKMATTEHIIISKYNFSTKKETKP